jgi:hypothetical protein
MGATMSGEVASLVAERTPACRICGTPSVEVGTKRGRLQSTTFTLRQCPSCRFSFIANPYTDYEGVDSRLGVTRHPVGWAA